MFKTNVVQTVFFSNERLNFDSVFEFSELF